MTRTLRYAAAPAVAGLLLAAFGCGPGAEPDGADAGGAAGPAGLQIAFGPDFEPVDSPAGPGSGEPNLAAGPAGVWMSWLEPVESPDSGGGHALRLARWDGTAWSDPSTVVSGVPFFVNWADFPSVLPLADGSLAAHWLEKTGDGTYAYGVRVSVSTDGGGTWSDPVSPHRDATPTEHGFVSLVDLGGGTFGVFWLDGRKFAGAAAGEEPAAGHDGEGHGGADMALRFARFSNGRFGPETELDPRVCDCCQTAASVVPGGMVVAYRDRTAGEVRDISFVRGDGEAWTGPASLSDDGWEIAGCPVNGPALAAAGERVVAAWFTDAGGRAEVKAAFSADGGRTFGPAVRIDEGRPLGRVDVEWLPGGAAAVSWIEADEPARGMGGGDPAAGAGEFDAKILLRRVTPEGGLSDSRLIARTTGVRASGFPRIARDGSSLIAAWTVPGEPSRILVARSRTEKGG